MYALIDLSNQMLEVNNQLYTGLVSASPRVPRRASKARGWKPSSSAPTF